MRLPSPSSARLLPCLLLALLGGCQFSGGESAEVVAARKEAEGKAIGGACRHAGRAIEDCFGLNKRADKAALFAGWREMNDYMRENKIEAVVPQGGVLAEAAPDKAADSAPEKPAKPADAAPAVDSLPKKPAKGKKHDS